MVGSLSYKWQQSIGAHATMQYLNAPQYTKNTLFLSQIFEAEYPNQKARRQEGHILRRQTQVDVQTTLINDLEQKA